MRTLLERCFGSVRLAQRWIEYVRERKSLRVDSTGYYGPRVSMEAKHV